PHLAAVNSPCRTLCKLVAAVRLHRLVSTVCRPFFLTCSFLGLCFQIQWSSNGGAIALALNWELTIFPASQESVYIALSSHLNIIRVFF
ncbi:hypothetical protein LINPERPRIM_LOCUS33350, partial [Linum perenne]